MRLCLAKGLVMRILKPLDACVMPINARAVRCMFLGYPHGQKGWKLYDIATQKILVSRDV